MKKKIEEEVRTSTRQKRKPNQGAYNRVTYSWNILRWYRE